MNYQIIELDEVLGTITVLYKDTTVIIELPINDNGFALVGKALENHIINHLPIEHYARLDKIKKGIPNVDKISALVIPLEKPLSTTIETPTPTPLATKLSLIVAERDNRLSGSDWTQLEDVVANKGLSWSDEWKEYRQLLRDMTSNIIDIDKVTFPIPPSM